MKMCVVKLHLTLCVYTQICQMCAGICECILIFVNVYPSLFMYIRLYETSIKI